MNQDDICQNISLSNFSKVFIIRIKVREGLKKGEIFPGCGKDPFLEQSVLFSLQWWQETYVPQPQAHRIIIVDFIFQDDSHYYWHSSPVQVNFYCFIIVLVDCFLLGIAHLKVWKLEAPPPRKIFISYPFPNSKLVLASVCFWSLGIAEESSCPEHDLGLVRSSNIGCKLYF